MFEEHDILFKKIQSFTKKYQVGESASNSYLDMKLAKSYYFSQLMRYRYLLFFYTNGATDFNSSDSMRLTFCSTLPELPCPQITTITSRRHKGI